MSWYKVTLKGEHAKLHPWAFVEEFLEYFKQNIVDSSLPRLGPHAFVYKRNDDPLTYYFAPDGVEFWRPLIEEYGGEPCFKPLASDVSQAIGGKDATKFIND
jgi:hypothetical protein